MFFYMFLPSNIWVFYGFLWFSVNFSHHPILWQGEQKHQKMLLGTTGLKTGDPHSFLARQISEITGDFNGINYTFYKWGDFYSYLELV